MFKFNEIRKISFSNVIFFMHLAKYMQKCKKIINWANIISDVEPELF